MKIVQNIGSTQYTLLIRHILVYAAVLHMLHSVKSEEKKDAERVVK